MRKFIFLITFMMLGVMTLVDNAFAQVDPEQAGALLKPVLDLIMTYLPENVIAVIALIGGFRVIFKPLMALLEAVAIYTPTKKDDKLYESISEGNTYKTIRFIFDYIASIKLPEKKK